MSNIYESPQAPTKREVSSVSSDDVVTFGMVEGLEKGKKWAKFIVYMLYLYISMIVVGLLGISLALALGSLSEIASKALEVEKFAINQSFLIGAVIVIFIVAIVMIYILLRAARSMKAYSIACNALSDTRSFEDLESCYIHFTDYVKFSLIVSATGVVLGIFVFLGA